MPVVFGIVFSYLALVVGFLIRFIQDDKDGLRDGFDDSEEVSNG